jgi:hypothetical protein
VFPEPPTGVDTSPVEFPVLGARAKTLSSAFEKVPVVVGGALVDETLDPPDLVLLKRLPTGALSGRSLKLNGLGPLLDPIAPSEVLEEDFEAVSAVLFAESGEDGYGDDGFAVMRAGFGLGGTSDV